MRLEEKLNLEKQPEAGTLSVNKMDLAAHTKDLAAPRRQYTVYDLKADKRAWTDEEHKLFL